MTTLLIIRERLKNIYGTYDYYFIPIVKFICALGSILLINSRIGYMTQIRTFPIMGMIAVVSAILPTSLIVLVLCIYFVLNVYALSLEMSIVVLVILTLMYLLYYKFATKDGIMLILVPVLFILKVPYMAPLIAGVAMSPASMISVAFGTLLYYIMDYISNNAITITNIQVDNALEKVKVLIDALFRDKAMYVTVIVFCMVIFVVFIIKRRSIDYARTIAIISGSIFMLAAFLLANIVSGVSVAPAFSMIFGTIFSTIIALLLDFCVLSVDYSRIERIQFEDDDYYYYVKAVPKINVSAPEVNIKRINARRTRRAR